jgi:hypothetical protein
MHTNGSRLGLEATRREVRPVDAYGQNELGKLGQLAIEQIDPLLEGFSVLHAKRHFGCTMKAKAKRS